MEELDFPAANLHIQICCAALIYGHYLALFEPKQIRAATLFLIELISCLVYK